MKHFEDVEWILYKNDLISEKRQIEMEDHLYTCDKCMENFLSLTIEKEVKGAADLIPKDFTENVLDLIKDMTPKEKKKNLRKQIEKPFNDLFLYYTAAALVAIVLTGGGLFGKMVDSVPNINTVISIEESKIKTDTIYNLSGKIADMTSTFVNNFELKSKEE